MSELLARDARHVWHPFTQAGYGHAPLPVARARGAWLELSDGRRLLDGISSWWCVLHGHSHPQLVAALTEQAQTLDQVLFAGCTHEPAVDLAERILGLLPDRIKRVFYSDNGSTAVEVAIKMAVQSWRNRGEVRTGVIALDDAYHGDTFGAMAAGARGLFSDPFDPLLFSVERLGIRGSREDLERCERLCASRSIAAMIFEPAVQGAGGMRMYELDVLDRYMEICSAYGVLCIADEVMTGFGRTGPLFVSNGLRRSPDVVCLSKGLTGGMLPLSITACSEEIFESFKSQEITKTFFHGHTYTANPLACAVARSSLTLSTSAECAEQRRLINLSHLDCIERLTGCPKISNPRAAGTILAFDVHSGDDAGYASSVRDGAGAFFRERGILIRPLGNVVYFMPPYCISLEELRHVHSSMYEYACSL